MRKLPGRVGSGHEVFENLTGRIGSGQEVFKSHGSDRVALARFYPRGVIIRPVESPDKNGEKSATAIIARFACTVLSEGYVVLRVGRWGIRVRR